MICVENPMRSTKKIYQNKYVSLAKLQDKIIIQKAIVFLYTNNGQLEIEVKKTLSIIVSKNMGILSYKFD